MKNFKFESIYLLSHREKRGRFVKFHQRKNLIIGRNHTGKSSLIKHLFLTLGARPNGDLPGWDKNAVSAVYFTVNARRYLALYQLGNRALFDQDNRLLVATGYHNEWSEQFSLITGFNLTLINKNNETIQADPSCFFLPFYINQDGSWQGEWNTFVSTRRYKSPTSNILEYFTGIKPPEYYEISAEVKLLSNKLEELRGEQKFLNRARERFSRSLSLNGPKINSDNFILELNRLTKEVTGLNERQESIRDRIVRQSETIEALKLQIVLAKDALSTYDLDANFLQRSDRNELICPTCGAEHTHNFLDFFTYAEDARVLREIISKLISDKNKLITLHENTKNELFKLEKRYIAISSILDIRKGDLKFKDVIESVGSEKAFRVFEDEANELEENIGQLLSKKDSLERELKKLSDKKISKEVLRNFRSTYASSRNMLNLPLVEISKMKLTSRPNFSGSGGPRSILAYYSAIWKAIISAREAFILPIVIDSPNQQAQDDINMPLVLKFISNNLPSEMQLIVGSESDTSLMFENRIELSSPYGLLEEKQFDDMSTKINPILGEMYKTIYESRGELMPQAEAHDIRKRSRDMPTRRYKYRPEDFEDLPVVLHHLTILLNFHESAVDAENRLDMTARRELDSLALDAADLEIVSVELVSSPEGEEAHPLSYDYRKQENRLFITLPRKYAQGERLSLRTRTRCFPSEYELEGIYKDATPPGAPQQFMSQCQQWGFQRIMPIFDDCRAKCTMTTTLEADVAYTHMISNGNIDRSTNPDGRPVPKQGDPSRQVITYDNRVPMAPYLFIAAVGTWDELADEVVYPSGKKVRLEYLVPRGRVEGARIPMEILKDSVLWVGRTQDYEYTGDTYRTICMTRSNFGGMENVGNTTIVTDAALIDRHTPDSSLLYAHQVIVHEFEHNQCGSETTMDTPFDVWLNEAYTVDVERRYMEDRFDQAFVRLRQVDAIRDPLLGPFAIEDGGQAGRIVREGFNHPDELIDGVTYVKAAEVIRMLRTLLGKEKFDQGKALYFSRYHMGNANTDQFFACFEEVSGSSLAQFKAGWLHTMGYPRVKATTEYDPRKHQYRIRFSQEYPGERPFHLPVETALVDETGKDIPGTSRVFVLSDREAELVFDNITRPVAFASLNRDASFYGTFEHGNVSADELALQAGDDPNRFNRVEAFRKLTDRERVKLLHDINSDVDGRWLELYGSLLKDPTLSPSLKAYFLKIEEQSLDRRYCVWYPELVAAKDRLTAEVNRAWKPELIAAFNSLDTYRSSVSPRDGIEERLLKAVLLELATADDSTEGHELILNHFRNGITSTDKVAALVLLNRSSSPLRREVLEETYEDWHSHLSGYANYLRVVASGTREDVFDMIEREKERPSFDLSQPTWCRALFLPMAVNTRMLWTKRGIDWLAGKIIELAALNTTTASRMLNAFQHVRMLNSALKEPVIRALERIVKEVGDEASPTIHRQAVSYRDSVVTAGDED